MADSDAGEHSSARYVGAACKHTLQLVRGGLVAADRILVMTVSFLHTIGPQSSTPIRSTSRLVNLDWPTNEIVHIADLIIEADNWGHIGQWRREAGASRGTCPGWKGLCPGGRRGPKLIELTQRLNC